MLSSLGIPVYSPTPQNQLGESFGEKLSNSIQDVFDKGFEKVIVVGNDCLLLNKAMIKRAYQNLQNNHVVIGPDKRGGIYLLGLSKKHFTKKDVEQLPWQTANLSAALQDYFKRLQVTQIVLNTLNDVNQTTDLLLVNSAGRPSNVVVHFIVDLFLCISYSFSRLNLPVQQLALANIGLRAPPIACS